MRMVGDPAFDTLGWPIPSVATHKPELSEGRRGGRDSRPTIAIVESEICQRHRRRTARWAPTVRRSSLPGPRLLVLDDRDQKFIPSGGNDWIRNSAGAFR